jgi:hypothetical protein
MASLCLTFFLTACGGAHTATPTGPIPSPSTTLQAETGNNTSAANSFAAQTNGNAAAGSVSKLPISSLLYSGSTTKIYATWLGWFGQPNHMSVGYVSDTQAQVHAQVQDMISRGIAGAIADWYGVNNASIENATTLLKNEAEASSGQFQFAIMEDGGALASSHRNMNPPRHISELMAGRWCTSSMWTPFILIGPVCFHPFLEIRWCFCEERMA